MRGVPKGEGTRETTHNAQRTREETPRLGLAEFTGLGLGLLFFGLLLLLLLVLVLVLLFRPPPSFCFLVFLVSWRRRLLRRITRTCWHPSLLPVILLMRLHPLSLCRLRLRPRGLLQARPIPRTHFYATHLRMGSGDPRQTQPCSSTACLFYVVS